MLAHLQSPMIVSVPLCSKTHCCRFLFMGNLKMEQKLVVEKRRLATIQIFAEGKEVTKQIFSENKAWRKTDICGCSPAQGRRRTESWQRFKRRSHWSPSLLMNDRCSNISSRPFAIYVYSLRNEKEHFLCMCANSKYVGPMHQ